MLHSRYCNYLNISVEVSYTFSYTTMLPTDRALKIGKLERFWSISTKKIESLTNNLLLNFTQQNIFNLVLSLSEHFSVLCCRCCGGESTRSTHMLTAVTLTLMLHSPPPPPLHQHSSSPIGNTWAPEGAGRGRDVLHITHS
jgi:hypothetical protein